jgi:hypothetical protein
VRASGTGNASPDVLWLRVVALSEIGKRMLVGRKLRSTQLEETLLPKRIALPGFAYDALSRVAYTPDEILLRGAASVVTGLD